VVVRVASFRGESTGETPAGTYIAEPEGVGKCGRALTMLAVPQITHYVLDGFIWPGDGADNSLVICVYNKDYHTSPFLTTRNDPAMKKKPGPPGARRTLLSLICFATRSSPAACHATTSHAESPLDRLPNCCEVAPSSSRFLTFETQPLKDLQRYFPYPPTDLAA